MSVAHLIQILLHGISLLRVAEALQTDFVFNGFIGKDLRLIRDASIDVSRVLSLTKDSELSTGRAFYPKPLKMKNKSFSTTFIFSIAPARGYSPGHGFAFLLTPYANLRGALPAQYLGLLNTTADKSESDHLFAVEFDTCDNIELQDINDNHVGVDLNSLRSTNSTPAGYWIGSHNEGAHGSFQFRNLSLNSGQNIQAWLEYDGARKHLNITISPAGYDRPLRPLLSQDMDLSDLFIDDMYAGFSASTGSLVESNFILAWSLSTSGRVAKSLDASNLPSFLPRNIERSRLKSRGFIVTMSGVSIALLALFILAVIRIHKNGLGDEEELIEDWELEFWPHNSSRKELSKIITKDTLLF